MDDVTYAHYAVFRKVPGRTPLTGHEVSEATQEIENLFKESSDTVTLRGSYVAEGFRPDADLILWTVASRPEDLQDRYIRFRRTLLGRRLEATWTFAGVHRPAEFAPDHQPAFMKGEKPKRYLCVYPFVRSPEWYLLSKEDRGRMLREHGEMGREFPEVLANTTSNFGLGDWEWILAFEADELHRIVDCIRRLRDAEARRYTKEEVPFVVGIRKELAAAVRDLS